MPQSGLSRPAAVRRNQHAGGRAVACPRRIAKRSPFRYFETSPEIIRLAVMLDLRFALSRRRRVRIWRAAPSGEMREIILAGAFTINVCGAAMKAAAESVGITQIDFDDFHP